MTTFRPPEVTPEFNQSGWSIGVVDRLAIADLVLESTLSARQFEINVNTRHAAPMVYGPQTQSGSYFNDQERDVDSFQWVETVSLSRNWRGQHVLKTGTDLAFAVQRHSASAGRSSPSARRRWPSGRCSDRHAAEVSGTEFALFAQDRWRIGTRSRSSWVANGSRRGRQSLNWSPRAGAASGPARGSRHRPRWLR